MQSVWWRSLTHISAHEAAYNKAGILHRDISPGNIMIVDKGELNTTGDKDESNTTGSILIDWDLSKKLKPENKRTSARRYRRTVSKFYEAPLRPDIYSH